MIETGRLVHGPYDVGHASRPKFGETACGDAVWVASAGDEIHVAVIDGLGHGPAAAEAAAAAVKLVASQPWGELARLMAECDRALHGTRGAAVTLVRILRHGGTEHCGIGNIALAFRGTGSKGAYSRPGIVGGSPRAVAVDRFKVGPGDMLAVFTDGLSSRLVPEEIERETSERNAARLITQWGKGHDDASCVVIHRRLGD
jgi:negative regulator of sigma-B (phosphoserine phosphatase)